MTIVVLYVITIQGDGGRQSIHVAATGGHLAVISNLVNKHGINARVKSMVIIFSSTQRLANTASYNVCHTYSLACNQFTLLHLMDMLKLLFSSLNNME